MATLSSASTNDQVNAAYEDNASYEEEGSAAKARAFITACKFILNRRIVSHATNGHSVTRDLGVIERQMTSAQEWLQTHNDTTAGAASSGPRVTRVDFTNFR